MAPPYRKSSPEKAMGTFALRKAEKATQGQELITTSMKFTRAAQRALRVIRLQICAKHAQRPLTDAKSHNAQKFLTDASPHKPTKAAQKP
jgi:hypothetical protein